MTRGPRLVRVEDAEELEGALQGLDLGGGRPVAVLVGGAAGMDGPEVDALAQVLSTAVLPALEEGSAVVDGGTDAGVMRAAGRALASSRRPLALVGVAAEGTVAVPDGSDTAPGAVVLEPGHTHAVLVPGREWGDESVWIDLVATSVAAGLPSVTVLANGGSISGVDVERSIARNRPVVVLAGSGRLADEIADAPGSGPTGAPASRIARSDLTVVVDMHDLDAVSAAVSAAMSGSWGAP